VGGTILRGGIVNGIGLSDHLPGYLYWRVRYYSIRVTYMNGSVIKIPLYRDAALKI
jgi:hypothetical protein